MNRLKLIGIFVIIFLGLSFSYAHAVPELQLYIPGATYVSGENGWATDSWFTENSAFELWAIGSKKNAQSASVLTNVTLVMAVPDGEYGTINIDNIPHDSPYPFSFTRSLGDNDFTFGNPFDGNKKHGIYDTWYVTLNLGDMVLGSMSVQNMVDPYDGEDTIQNKPGNIFKFDFSKTGFSKVHFDLYADGGIFAPFSHDAEDGPIPPPVPEPATMSLLGLGLLGVLGFRRKKV